MSVSFSPLGGFAAQFFDNNGVPLAGGKIFTYVAGTTTPQATYTSSSGTTPHANPIVLDSAGRVPGGELWLTNGADYKFVIETATGVLIGTYDNISSTNAQDILFLQAGTGAVPRTVQSKLRETISVKDFGATGDGVTDDTAAIQTAINYAISFASGNGFEVDLFFPAGDYLYTTLLVNGDRINLVGNANLTKTTTTGPGIFFDGGAPGSRRFGGGVNGLTLGSAAAATQGALLTFLRYSQVEVKCQIKPFPAACWDGIYFQECTAVNLLEGTSVESCLADGIHFNDCIDVYFNQGRSDANANNGVVIENVSGLYASGWTCFGNGLHGWSIDSQSVPVLADANGFMFFSDCIGDTSGSHNWFIRKCYNSVFSSCWAASQSNSVADLHGFFLDGSFELEFQGCLALSNNGCGFRDGGVSAGVNIRIAGGRFNDNGKVAGSTLRAGVSLRNSCDYTLNGVRMSDTRAGGSKTQQQGLQIDATLVALSVSDCDMRGNASAPYLFAALPTLFRQSNNLTGETPVYASATDVTTSPFIDTFSVTGTTDIASFLPRYAGRRSVAMMTDSAQILDEGSVGGSDIALPAPNITPGADGTASFIYNGSKWLCTGFEVNDGT